MENGANDTNEMTRWGTKCRGIFGLICLVNIFAGILLTMRGATHKYRNQTRDKLNEKFVFLTTVKNRVGTL
jgi:glucose uptake protein GlcU